MSLRVNPNERCGSLFKAMSYVGDWVQDLLPLFGRSAHSPPPPRSGPPPEFRAQLNTSGPVLRPPPAEKPSSLLTLEHKYFLLFCEKEEISALRRTCKVLNAYLRNEKNLWNHLYDRNVALLKSPHKTYQTAYQFHSNVIRGIFSLQRIELGKFIPATIIGSSAISGATRRLKSLDLSTERTLQIDGKIRGIISAFFVRNTWIVGTIDGTVRLWDTYTGQMKTFTRPSHHARAFAVSGGTLFSGSDEGAIAVWELKSGKNLSSLKEHTGGVRCLATTTSHLISGSHDFTIKIWELDNLKKFSTLSGHARGVACLVVDNETLFSGSDDHTIKVWNLKTRQCAKTLNGHTGLVTCLLLHDGLLFSGSTDQTIRVWNPTTGECLSTLIGHGERISSLSFSDRKLISFGGWDHRVMKWDFMATQYKILEEIAITLKSGKDLDRALRRFSSLSKSAKKDVYAKLGDQEKFQSATPKQKAEAVEAYLAEKK